MLSYPFDEAPKEGQVFEIVPGIYWSRVKLPMYIDHVNVYILKDDCGLTIIDTGLNVSSCVANWKAILRNNFKGLSVNRVISTHHHPDHVGLAGWFKSEYKSEIWMSRTAWLMARMLTLDVQEEVSSEAIKFWKSAGMPLDRVREKIKKRPINFADGVAQIPLGYQRVFDEQKIKIGDNLWKVRLGNGHAPDHVTLWNTNLKVLIAGDQVLPGISSNLSVYPTEPMANPVGEWIETCVRFKKYSVESNYLVLPGHKLPFYGLQERLNHLIANHQNAFSRIKGELTKGSRTTVELFRTIFKREIGESEYGLALGEAVGHLNYLYHTGQVRRTIKENTIHYSLVD